VNLWIFCNPFPWIAKKRVRTAGFLTRERELPRPHRTMKSILSIAITAAAWTVSSATVGFAQTSLPDLEAGFALESARLGEPHLALDAKFRDHLEALKSSYQKAGNLKGMLAVEEEMEGFTGKTEPSEFAELKRLQDIYQSQRTALEAQRQDVYRRLLGQYRAKAETLAAESTKAGRIEDAKLALAASEKFAAMEKAAAAQRPATAPSPAPSAVPAGGITPPALLEEAKTAIRRVNDPKVQARLWRDHGRALAVCGNLKEAELTAKRIDDAEVKSAALTDIAAVLVEVGKFDEAVALTHAIPVRFQADLCLAMIAAAQLARNDANGATRTGENIRGAAGKCLHHVDLAKSRLAAGDEAGFRMKINEARALALPLSDPIEMKEAFKKIAVSEVEAGDLAAARATANQFRGNRFDSPILFVIEALAKKGDFRAAHDLRGSSGFTKFTGSVSGAMIAEAEAAAGKFQEAKNTAKGISYDGPRQTTYSKIAVIEGELAGARASAEALLQGPDMNENRYENGGRVLAPTGVLQARMEGLPAALGWARALEHPTVRSLALIALAEFAASAGGR